MGGASYAGFDVKLRLESRLGWGDWIGVSGSDCGATSGDT